MANKRQREARKRFHDANPSLYPPTPAAPPADKKSMFKKVKKDGVSGGGAGRSKHPLRVPGIRPGERCFICKATDHAAKACVEKTLWDKNKGAGHSLKNCPEKSDGNLNSAITVVDLDIPFRSAPSPLKMDEHFEVDNLATKLTGYL